MTTKAARRYQELFKQTPRAALVGQVSRDIFESRLSHHHWSHLSESYADKLTNVDIAAVAEGAVAPYNPAYGRVVGTALYECYHAMSGRQFASFATDVRQALKERIMKMIGKGQCQDIVWRSLNKL